MQKPLTTAAVRSVARRRCAELAACWLATTLLTACAGGAPAGGDTAGRSAQAQRAAEQRALAQLLAAVKSDDRFLRANAIEAASFMPRRAAAMVTLGLKDESPVVRFAALAVLGKLKLTELAPDARRLLSDKDLSVLAAALFALGQCGGEVDLSRMAQLLASPHPGTRANVALLLGMAGDPSAIPLLREAARRPLQQTSPQQAAIVRLQIAEAVVKLGDEDALDAIQAGAFSQFGEVRILAVAILGRLRDRQMQPALTGMLSRPPVELQVAAAEALAAMGRYHGLEAVLSASRSSIPTVRGQAAISLARFPQREAGDRLLELLDDREALVRVAAAAAVLRRSHDQASAPTARSRHPGRGGTECSFFLVTAPTRLTKPSRQVKVWHALSFGGGESQWARARLGGCRDRASGVS